MSERVSTGGIKTFQYEKGHNPKLSTEEKLEIKEAYAKADERRRKEKRNRLIITIIAIVIILSIIFGIILI